METTEKENPMKCILDALKERKITSLEFGIWLNTKKGENSFYIVGSLYKCKIKGQAQLLMIETMLPLNYN